MFDPAATAMRSALAAMSGGGIGGGSQRDLEEMTIEELEAVVEMGKRRERLVARGGDIAGFGFGLMATLGVARML